MNIMIAYRCFLLAFCGLYVSILWNDYQRTPVVIKAEKMSVLSELPEAQRLEAQFPPLAGLLDLSEVIQRPLFIDGRQVPSTKKQVGIAKQNTRRDRFTLEVTGIVTSGDTRMAVLRNTATKTEETLYIGGELPDNYAEWTLDDVDNKQVVVKKNIPNDNNNVDPNDENTKKLPLAEGVYYKINENTPKLNK